MLSLFPEDSSEVVVGSAVCLVTSVCSDLDLSTASKYGALSLLVGALLATATRGFRVAMPSSQRYC